MQTAWGIVTHTPYWVFALLAFLIWRGVAASKDRSTRIANLLIVPTVFFAMGVSRLVLYRSNDFTIVACWCAAAITLGIVGWITGPKRMSIDRATGQIALAGSWTPLFRNIVVFALQYAVAVTAAMHLGVSRGLAVLGAAVSGATAGYFLGWGVRLILRYRAAMADPGSAA